MSHRAKHVNSSHEKKTSIDKRLFVQFITAVRQIEASSRVQIPPEIRPKSVKNKLS